MRYGGYAYFKKNSGAKADLFYCKNKHTCGCPGRMKKHHENGLLEESKPHSDKCIAKANGNVFTQANGEENYELFQRKLIASFAMKPELTAGDVYDKVIE